MVGSWAALAAAPVPDRRTPLAEVELLALDLETTGLDPRRHEVLSVGLVPVLGGEVPLARARHLRVRPHGDVGDSATVHGLTDDALRPAPPWPQVRAEVLAALVGDDGRRRVLLAHYATLERGFLGAPRRGLAGPRVRLPVVDTLETERRLLRAQGRAPAGAELHLDACRRRHHLPRYPAHDALADALGCAELFLAQWARLEEERGRPLVLADVLEA